MTFRFADDAGNVGTGTSTASVLMYGDLNLDGVADPSDMVVLRAYFNFAATPGTAPFTAPLDLADLSHDGFVDPTDLVLLRAYFNSSVGCLAP